MQELQTIHGLALFVAAVAGLAVAHRAVLCLPTGLPRLFFILPILPIFFMLPWTIPIYHFRAILSFIFLWTVPSKLLLLCWDAGIDYPSSGFLYFATIVMLPIRVRGKKSKTESQNSARERQFWWQFIAVIIILNIYSYRKGLPLWAIYVLYTCHMYLGLELMLGGLAKLATACFGVESDPQFNNPFMSASLSEFWGRRWNLVVTTILRSTVYNPALLLLMRAEKQKAHVTRPFTSSTSHSCAQNTSPNSQGRENHVASLDDQGTNSDHLNAKIMNTSHVTQSKNSNTSFAKQETAEPTSQIDTQAPRSNLTIDMYDTEALKEQGRLLTQSSLVFDIHEKPGLHSNPSSLRSKGSMPEAEDGINGTQMSSTGEATKITSCKHNSPNSNMNSKDLALNPESECDPKPHPTFPACDPEPLFLAVSKKPSWQSMYNPDCHTLHAIGCNSDLNPDITSYPNPVIDMHEERNGISPRTSAAAMLRVRAAGMLTNSVNPAPMNPDSQNYNPQTGAEQKSAMYPGEKPSLRARAVALLVTFAVSGLVHELIFYYINKSRATGEVTAFFILHGCATALEVLLKKTLLAHVRLPRALSIALTLAFLYATAAWLFMPPLTRYNADINIIAEYQRLQSALVSFVTKRKTMK